MRTVVNMSENFDNDKKETNLDGLIIKFNSELSGRLIDGWKWLLGENMTVIMISSAGDLFLIPWFVCYSLRGRVAHRP